MQKFRLFEDFFDDHDIDIYDKTDDTEDIDSDGGLYKMEMYFVLKFTNQKTGSRFNIRKYINKFSYLASQVPRCNYKQIGIRYTDGKSLAKIEDYFDMTDDVMQNGIEVKSYFDIGLVIDFDLLFDKILTFDEFCKVISNFKIKVEKSFINEFDLSDYYIASRIDNMQMIYFNARTDVQMVEKLYVKTFGKKPDEIINILSQNYSEQAVENISITRIGKKLENFTKFNDSIKINIKVCNFYKPADFNRDAYGLFLDVSMKDGSKVVESSYIEWVLLEFMRKLSVEQMQYMYLVFCVRCTGSNVLRFDTKKLTHEPEEYIMKSSAQKVIYDVNGLWFVDRHIKKLSANKVDCLLMYFENDGSYYKNPECFKCRISGPYHNFTTKMVANSKNFFNN